MVMVSVRFKFRVRFSIRVRFRVSVNLIITVIIRNALGLGLWLVL